MMDQGMLAGLFGATPEQLQAKQYQDDSAFADRYAQLSPLQQATAGFSRTGGMLGRALGNQIGMEDLQVTQARQAQSLQSQIDHSSAEGLLKGAQMFNAAGNPRMAAMYMQAAQAKQAADSKMVLEQAQAGKAAAQAELDYAKAFNEMTKSEKEKLSAYGQQLVDSGLKPGTPEFQAKMKEYLDAQITEKTKPAASVKVAVNAGETEQDKVYGKQLGEIRGSLAANAFAAPTKLAQLARMEQLLEGVEGGKLAPLGAEIASAANSIGIKIDPKLGNKQAAESLAREIAASFRQAGTGPMTDKDFENFMKRVPDLSKTAAGRKEIIATMRSALNRDIEASKLARDYANRNNGRINDAFIDELAGFYAKNPVTTAPTNVSSVRAQADSIIRKK